VSTNNPDTNHPDAENLDTENAKKKRSWKKVLLWSIAGIFVLIVVVVFTGVLLLEHDQSFRHSILSKVEHSLEESTGAQISVRDVKLHLATLSLDLYDVVVRGAESDPSRPLLQADHLGVGVKIVSLVHRTWHLQDVTINHPVVHLFVNKAGDNNLPKARQKSTSTTRTNIFDLAIQKLLLDRGEIYYNDKKSALDAELRDLLVNVSFDNSQTRYLGDLSYHQGRLQYGAYAPVVHDLQAKFDLSPTRFNLDQMVLATGASKMELKAAVDDYTSNARVQASYNAELVADDLKRILKDATLPTGTVRLDGNLTYQGDPRNPNRPALELVSLAGNMSSRAIAVKMPSFHGEVRDVGAHYKLDQGNAEVQNIHAQLLGGRLDGRLTIHDVAGAGQARLQAGLKGISLQQVQAASGNRLQQADLSGTVNADADARWAKTLNNLVAHSDATIAAALRPKNSSASTPLNGVVHADYSNATRQIALNHSYIRTPQTSINLDGKVSDRSQLQVRMQSNDLHELELLADAFSKPTPGKPTQPLDLHGTATLNASITGSTASPRINGQLVANNLRVKGSSWKVLRTGINASPSQASLSNGDLEAATQGRINFNVQAGLKKWAYTPESPIQVQLSAFQLSVADLERLAGQTYPVSGTLAVSAAVHGSQLNPIGQGEIQLANARVSNEPIQTLDIRFQGTGNQVDANLNAKLPAGTAQGKVTYFPKDQGYQAELDASNLRLEKLQTVQARNLQVNGGLTLKVSGKGTVKDPQLNASLQIPVLQVQKQTIKGLSLNTGIKNHIATIALNSEVAQTYVRGNGTVGIEAPYMANIRLDTGRIAFQPLLALYAPAQAANMSGETELHATVRGPLQDKAKVEAHVEVPVLAANYKQLVQLAATQPIRLDYVNGVATLQPTSIQGTGTDIHMQGTVPVTSPKAASFLVQGTVDLQLAQMIQPDIQSSGQLKFDVNSQRYGAGSNIEGEIRVVNANFQSISAPLGLTNGNGVLTVTRDRLEIKSLEGQVGGGTVTAKGGVAYRPAVQFDLGLAVHNVRLRYPEGLRTVLGSDLSLSGTTQAALMSGQIRIEHVSFTDQFDMASFIGQFSGESSGAGPSPGLAENIKLNIALQSTSQMNLTSSKVSLQGTANLRIVGTAADPVILGRTNLSGGELFLASNRYLIQNGTINFVNPIRTEPVINLQVTTVVDQYNIALNFEGPIEHLKTTYTSDPALPPVDIINLLAVGRTTEAASTSPSATSALGAESVVASQLSSKVSGRVEKLAGISNLSIDPTLGGDQSNPGARVAIQQRVTSNLFVTFATDVTSTQRQQIQLEYKLNPRWSISGVRDQNGGFGVDGKYHKKF
jgi:translocation and assembly module TamB